MEDKTAKKMQGIAQQEVSAEKHKLNEQKKHDGKRLSSKKVLLSASNIWRDQAKAELIASKASHIIKQTYKVRPIFFGGKSEKRLLSGIFYILSIKNGTKKTQKEIAHSLNTNVVTVRDSYRDWMSNFPDLFPMETGQLNHDSHSCSASLD